jgi:hypothetical protein
LVLGLEGGSGSRGWFVWSNGVCAAGPGEAGNEAARRLTVEWSGAESVRPINLSTDAIKPSVWRNASLNAVRSIRLVWMAASRRWCTSTSGREMVE